MEAQLHAAVFSGNLQDVKRYAPLVKNFYTFDWSTMLWQACVNGHLSVAKWLLHEKGTKIVPPHFLFLMQCLASRGKLKVAKWFFNVIVHQAFGLETLFWNACNGGHLSFAKWVCTLGTPNAFSHLVNNGLDAVEINFKHLHIIKWLCRQFKVCRPYLLSIGIKSGAPLTTIKWIWNNGGSVGGSVPNVRQMLRAKTDIKVVQWLLRVSPMCKKLHHNRRILQLATFYL
jgi:hypothetical protein